MFKKRKIIASVMSFFMIQSMVIASIEAASVSEIQPEVGSSQSVDNTPKIGDVNGG